jgi:hypothetical protein
MHLFAVANCLSSHRVVASFLISPIARGREKTRRHGQHRSKEWCDNSPFAPPPLSLSLSTPLSLACLRWRHCIWLLVFFFVLAQGTHDEKTYDQPGFHLLPIVAWPECVPGSRVPWRFRDVPGSVSGVSRGMAGPGNDPVQFYRTMRASHWEFLRLWTGFELSSSWNVLPCSMEQI